MEVILLEKVANLGILGDKVKVKAGYGRNFLVPFGKAVSATKANVEAFEARRAELTITAKAGDEGKLFGSIGTRDLADAITAAGVEVAKSEIRMPTGPIRTIGEFDIALQLHTDVAATVKIFVEVE